MTLALALVVLGQYVTLMDEGGTVGTVRRLNCVGGGIICSASGSGGTINVSSGLGGGAPTSAKYLVQQADSELSNEQALGALSTGLMLNMTSTGVVSIFTGTSCSNQFIRSLSASGVATCASIALAADVSGVLPQANGGTGAGALTCGAGQFLTSNGTAYSCSTPSGVNVVETEVDFGDPPGADLATVVVTGQSWVTTTSKIDCSLPLLASPSRVEGAEDALIEGIRVSWRSRVESTGFTVVAHVPNGRASGKYVVHCFGR